MSYEPTYDDAFTVTPPFTGAAQASDNFTGAPITSGYASTPDPHADKSLVDVPLHIHGNNLGDCAHCGRCPHCGRGSYPGYYPTYPSWPTAFPTYPYYVPQVTYTCNAGTAGHVV